jgi:hydroxymethylglutaryl-CoA lyase
MPFDALPASPAVKVRDVGLRDGLQSIARTVPTEIKRLWLQPRYEAGLRELEVGSFVPGAAAAATGRHG